MNENKPSTNVVIDSERLNMLRKLDEQVFRSLVDSFVERCDVICQSIKAEFAAGNHKAVSFEAHSLKGISGSLGANQLASLCSEIQDDPSTDKLEQLATSIADAVMAISEFSKSSKKRA